MNVVDNYIKDLREEYGSALTLLDSVMSKPERDLFIGEYERSLRTLGFPSGSTARLTVISALMPLIEKAASTPDKEMKELFSAFLLTFIDSVVNAE